MRDAPRTPPFDGGGEQAKEPTPKRHQTASLIQSTEPPRGMDPRLHHTDVAANLNEVAKALSKPASPLPRVLQSVQPSSKSGGAAACSSLSATAAPNADNPAPIFDGPGGLGGPGQSEINMHLVTPAFLAAA